jgi:ABC-2 type transport system permease protein
MKQILAWELMTRKKFTIWWSVGVSALVAMTVLSYAAVEEQANMLNESLGDLSGSVGSFFGGEDLFSPVGFLSSQLYYIVLPILIIILTLTLVRSLMVRDEASNGVELLLARPVSRGKLLAARGFAAFCIVGFIGVISYIVAWFSAEAVSLTIDPFWLFATHWLSILFAASFGAVAFGLYALGGIFRTLAPAVAIILSFGGYLLASLGGFVDILADVAKAFPYAYYDTVALLEGTVESGLIVYLVIVYGFSIGLGWWGYRRRDIGV